MNPAAVLLALLGALFLVVGAGLVYLPAGVITAGVVLILTAYLIQYWRARR